MILFSAYELRALLSNGVFAAQGKDRYQGGELNIFRELAKSRRLLGGPDSMPLRRTTAASPRR